MEEDVGVEVRSWEGWMWEICRDGYSFWTNGGRGSGVMGWGIEWKVLLYGATDLLEGGLDWRRNDGVVGW